MTEPTKSRIRLGSRGALFGLVIAIGGWRIVAASATALSMRDPEAAFLLAPLAALVVALWRQQLGANELNVHDRQMDFTVVAVLVALALGVGLLTSRLGSFASAAGSDTFSIMLWTAASSVALFGIRATTRHFYSFGLLALLWSPPLLAASALIPADTFGSFAAATIVTVATGGILTGAGRRRGPTARRITTAVVLGFGLVVAACHGGRLRPAALVAGPLAVLVAGRLLGLSALPRPRLRSFLAVASRSPAVVDVRRALPVVVAIAFLGALVPSATASAVGTIGGDTPVARPIAAGACPDLGPGWKAAGQTRLGDHAHLGALATTRCRYASTAAQPASTVAVDLSDPEPIWVLASFPFEAEYRTIGAIAAREYRPRLPEGAEATMLPFDSPSRPLTTVVVTATLTGPSVRHGFARRFAVIVSDDPRPGSPLPVIAPHLGSAFLSRLSNIVRISPAEAQRSIPYPKNGDLADQLAAELVAQWVAQQ